MRSIIFIFLCCISLNCAAQKMKTFDTSFLNITTKDFFKKNPVVRELHYFTNFQSSRYISAYFSKDSSGNDDRKKNEYYNFNFIGDRYLFEKKYGTIDLPEREIQKAIVKKCFIDYFLDLTIKADSVKLSFKSHCSPENDDERIFTKVEVFAGYKPGMKQLEKDINAAVVKNYSPDSKTHLTDSVFIFRIIVGNKDSCLKEVKLMEGEDGFFSGVVAQALKNCCSWTPSMHGGRAVNAYIKVYIKYNKDQSLTVAYPEGN